MREDSKALFAGVPGVRDMAPSIESDELLERLLATVDDTVVDNAPAHGSLRGCALTLAARHADAVSALVYIERRYGRLDGVGWNRMLR